MFQQIIWFPHKKKNASFWCSTQMELFSAFPLYIRFRMVYVCQCGVSIFCIWFLSYLNIVIEVSEGCLLLGLLLITNILFYIECESVNHYVVSFLTINLDCINLKLKGSSDAWAFSSIAFPLCSLPRPMYFFFSFPMF